MMVNCFSLLSFPPHPGPLPGGEREKNRQPLSYTPLAPSPLGGEGRGEGEKESEGEEK